MRFRTGASSQVFLPALPIDPLTHRPQPSTSPNNNPSVRAGPKVKHHHSNEMEVMDIPVPSIEIDAFTLRGLQPASPPLTPGSPPVQRARRRPWWEHLRSLSYTPPRNGQHDEDASSSDGEDDYRWALRANAMFYNSQKAKISQESSQLKSERSQISKVLEILSEPESDAARAETIPRGNDAVHIVITEELSFDLEEIFDHEFDSFDAHDVLRPYIVEDATSEKGAEEARDIDTSLTEQLRKLKCSLASQSTEFDHQQRMRAWRRKKRWSRGGSHKRSHTESVGSDSADDDDIELLDPPGPSNRRLRRRTKGPEDMIRPRTSLLFDEIPAELDELKYLEENIPPDLAEDVAELEDLVEPFWMDQIWVDDVSELSADEEEVFTDDERPLPRWLYMEIESNPSRPTTAGGRLGPS